MISLRFFYFGKVCSYLFFRDRGLQICYLMGAEAIKGFRKYRKAQAAKSQSLFANKKKDLTVDAP